MQEKHPIVRAETYIVTVMILNFSVFKKSSNFFSISFVCSFGLLPKKTIILLYAEKGRLLPTVNRIVASSLFAGFIALFLRLTVF